MEERALCQLCFTGRSQYRCPRCHVNYCSLPCYQSDKHLQCSERFYKHNVVTNLKHNPEYAHATLEDKRGMEEMLRRFEAQQLEDESEGGDVAAAAEAGAGSWEALSKSQQDEFNSLYAEDKLGSLLPVWVPWWQDVAREDTRPRIIAQRPDVTRVVEQKGESGQLSACIGPGVVNILYSYAYVSKVYLGEHASECVAAVADLGALCDQLSATPPPHPSVAAAIHASIHTLQPTDHPLHNSRHFTIATLHDVVHILQGGGTSSSAQPPPLVHSNTCVLSAISDLIRLFTAVKRQYKRAPAPSESQHGRSEYGHVLRCIKKLEFLLEYVRIDKLDIVRLITELKYLIADLEQEKAEMVKDENLVSNVIKDRKANAAKDKIVEVSD